jgi:glutaredoxin
MGQITLFTKDGCSNCESVKRDLQFGQIPFEEIVLDASEIQRAPLVYFDNHPLVGGVDELWDILRDWEVKTGPDGKPTLERVASNNQQHYAEDERWGSNHRDQQYQSAPQRNGSWQDDSPDHHYSRDYHPPDPYSRGEHQHEQQQLSPNHSYPAQNNGYGHDPHGQQSYDPYYGRENYEQDHYHRRFSDDPYGNNHGRNHPDIHDTNNYNQNQHEAYLPHGHYHPRHDWHPQQHDHYQQHSHDNHNGDCYNDILYRGDDKDPGYPDDYSGRAHPKVNDNYQYQNSNTEEPYREGGDSLSNIRSLEETILSKFGDRSVPNLRTGGILKEDPPMPFQNNNAGNFRGPLDYKRSASARDLHHAQDLCIRETEDPVSTLQNLEYEMRAKSPNDNRSRFLARDTPEYKRSSSARERELHDVPDLCPGDHVDPVRKLQSLENEMIANPPKDIRNRFHFRDRPEYKGGAASARELLRPLNPQRNDDPLTTLQSIENDLRAGTPKDIRSRFHFRDRPEYKRGATSARDLRRPQSLSPGPAEDPFQHLQCVEEDVLAAASQDRSKFHLRTKPDFTKSASARDLYHSESLCGSDDDDDDDDDNDASGQRTSSSSLSRIEVFTKKAPAKKRNSFSRIPRRQISVSDKSDRSNKSNDEDESSSAQDHSAGENVSSRREIFLKAERPRSMRRLPCRQVSSSSKYKDDDDPFARKRGSSTTAMSKRHIFHNKAPAERHSFNKVVERQFSNSSKYSDDEDPFKRKDEPDATNAVSRRDMLRQKNAYDRHSFHGKTLSERNKGGDSLPDDSTEGESASAAVAKSPESEIGNDASASSTTTPKRRFDSRRDLFRRKMSYDRHSYGGKTLLQKQNSESEDSPRAKSISPLRGVLTISSNDSSVHDSESVTGEGDISEREKRALHASDSVSCASSHFSQGSIHIDTLADLASISDVDLDHGDEDDGERSTNGDEHHEQEENEEDEDEKGTATSPSEEVKKSKKSFSLSPVRRKPKLDLKKAPPLLASLDDEDSVEKAEDTRPSPMRVFSMPRSKDFSRSFRISESTKTKLKAFAGKAASMRYLNTHDTTSSGSAGLDSRPGRSKSGSGSASRTGRSRGRNARAGPQKYRPGSGLKPSRPAALMKSAQRLSNALNGEGSNTSLFSAASGSALKDDKRNVELPLGNRVSVLQAMLELKDLIPLDNHKHNLTTYRNSFSGCLLTDVFHERFNLSRREAEDLGKSLYQAQILRHVTLEHPFADSNKLFRLQCHQTPEVLNSFCIWQYELSLTKNGAEVLDEIMGRLLVVLDAITDSDKGRVHYSRATKYYEDLVEELDYAICELQMVKLARMDKNNLLAFGINVFQLFMHYAFIKVGIPSSSSAFTSFWTHLKFNVGGDLYSFADWWNGICRGNRKGPYGQKPFQGKDSRCFLNLPDPVDPRVHFAAGMTHFMRPM